MRLAMAVLSLISKLIQSLPSSRPPKDFQIKAYSNSAAFKKDSDFNFRAATLLLTDL